ncbi:MAG: YhcH/YjgK/YiaL family protein [Sulfurovaceae bacterium]|nr:YhcH/YjgK/YiaL family protein [Sulfurovaceae bacterium]
MIIDKVENFGLYRFGPAWQRAFEFLSTLTPDSPDGRYDIDGDDIFAIVMSYHTLTPEKAVFESHQKYVDIQTVITGAEGFECAFSDELNVITPYDADKEAAFYERTSHGQTRVDVFPGTFVMLYPHDAHIAGLLVGAESKLVKKVVVKVKIELLELEH